MPITDMPITDIPVIDIYGHVALPRFLSLDDYLRVMDENGVEAALLSTAETCPDLREMERARRRHPDRFRTVGLPLGPDPQGVRDNLRRQLGSGLSGIRLPAPFVAENPDVLDILGEAGAFAVVVGENGLSAAAAPLVAFLDRYPASFVVAGHFGGPADPALLDRDPAVGRLFDHPSLHVAFTRHGAMRHLPLEAWAAALVRRVGWTRLLWGSEWPVALWRDETYRATLDWALRLHPSPGDLESFRHGNARRLLFAPAPTPAQDTQDLPPPPDLTPWRRTADVWLFPPSLDLSEEQHRRWYHAFVAWGGDRRGPYSSFVREMAERGMEAEAVASGRG